MQMLPCVGAAMWPGSCPGLLSGLVSVLGLAASCSRGGPRKPEVPNFVKRAGRKKGKEGKREKKSERRPVFTAVFAFVWGKLAAGTSPLAEVAGGGPDGGCTCAGRLAAAGSGSRRTHGRGGAREREGRMIVAAPHCPPRASNPVTLQSRGRGRGWPQGRRGGMPPGCTGSGGRGYR